MDGERKRRISFMENGKIKDTYIHNQINVAEIYLISNEERGLWEFDTVGTYSRQKKQREAAKKPFRKSSLNVRSQTSLRATTPGSCGEPWNPYSEGT